MKTKYKLYLRTTSTIKHPSCLTSDNSNQSRNTTNTTNYFSSTQHFSSKKSSSFKTKSMFTPTSSATMKRIKNIKVIDSTHKEMLKMKYLNNKIRDNLSPLSCYHIHSMSYSDEELKRMRSLPYSKLEGRIIDNYTSIKRNCFIERTNKIRIVKTLLDLKKNECLVQTEANENLLSKVKISEYKLSNQYKFMKDVLIPLSDAYIKEMKKKAENESDRVDALKNEKMRLRKEINKLEQKIEKTKQELAKEIKCRNLMIAVKEKSLNLPDELLFENHKRTSENSLPSLRHKMSSSTIQFKRTNSIGKRVSIIKTKYNHSPSFKRESIIRTSSMTNNKYANYLNLNYEIFPSVNAFIENFDMIKKEIVNYTSIYLDKRQQLLDLKKELTHSEMTMKENEYMNDIIRENEIKLQNIKEQYEKNKKIHQQLTYERNKTSIKKEFNIHSYNKIYEILQRIVKNLIVIDNDIINNKLRLVLQSKEPPSQEKQYREWIMMLLQSIEKGTIKVLSIIEEYKSNPLNALLIKDIKIKIQNNRRVDNAKKQRKLLELQKEEVIKRIVEKKDKIYLLQRRKEVSSSSHRRVKLSINKTHQRNKTQLGNDYNVNYAYLTSY